jgi:hypothetical protein
MTTNRYEKIPEGEIKKCSRQWLAEVYRTITPAKVELFRDTLINLVAALDAYSKRIKKTKSRDLGRPPALT